ncbi:twin-arginine translocation signal domain-containing protein, partial [Acidovorax sp.]
KKKFSRRKFLVRSAVGVGVWAGGIRGSVHGWQER